jgi:hypothetical protein
MPETQDTAPRRRKPAPDPSTNGTRPPPHNLDAEASLLGAAMLSSDALAVLATTTTSADFYKPANGHIAAALVKAHEEGWPADPVTIAAELDKRGLLDQVGGPAELIALQVAAPSSRNAGRYARIVHDHATSRRRLDLLARAQQAEEAGQPERADEFLRQAATTTTGRNRSTLAPIDWPTFWNQDRAEELFLVEPLIPAGRQVAIFSPPKSGKSLLGLELAAAVATGTPTLHRPAGPPVSVCYFDLEMTEDDLAERLEALGYGAAHELSHLHYFLLPDLPPLDTAAGGEAMAEILTAYHPELVMVDTISRALAGPENEADTIRNYVQHTGTKLRRAGVTGVRFDHSGKDVGRGQRGSSDKAGDVDVVWRLTRGDNGIHLKATHRRMGWIPEEVDLTVTSEPLRHRPSARTWPAGTKGLADALDELEVPIGASRRAARELFTAEVIDDFQKRGIKTRNDVLGSALRWRQEQHESEAR